MNRKIRFIIIACFIAGLAVTGFNMAQSNQSTGVSLADIAVMARADGESGGGGFYSCMQLGGTMKAAAYRCDDPGYPTLPEAKCGTPFMSRTGLKLVQCWK